MKLTILLLTVALLQVSAKTTGQTVTVSGKDLKLEQVFSIVKEQTGFVVFATMDVLKDAKPISVNVKQMPVSDFMNIVLKDQGLMFEISNETILVSKDVESVVKDVTPKVILDAPEAEPIKGVVKDSTGVPLSGATVINKRTKKSVQTNAKGEFTIAAEEGDVLALSFIGFETQNIRVAGSSMLAVLHVSSSPLDEIQIRAYGTTSKRLNTGNISTVKAAEIEKQPVNNPLLALQGRVPGLEITQTSGIPGAPVQVRLRGRNGLNDRVQDPLFVIDGLPYMNNISRGASGLNTDFSQSSAFSWINPQDIESIDVLKDADATAIYGSRGANGVVLITTKKGKIGANRLDINLQSGIGKVSRKINLMNVEQYKQMRYEALAYSGFQFNHPYYLEHPDELEAQLPDLLLWNGNHDWQKEMIGGSAQYTDLQGNVSGGTATMQYMIGGNYHKETTVFPGNSGDQKASTHFNISSVSLNQKFRVSLTGSYMADWSRYPGQDFTQFITLAPTLPDLLRADGSLNFAPFTYSYGFTRYLIENNPFQTLFQPYRSNVGNLTSGAEISYKILSGLIAKINVGYNQTIGEIFMKVNPYESKAPNYTDPRFSQFHSNKGNGLIVEPQLMYNVRLGQGTIDFLLGGSYQNSQTRTQSILARGFASDELMENLGSATQYQSANTSSQYKYNSAFARLGYNYRDKYLVGLNARRDGSSRFGPGKQFGNFGSVAAAWLFSEENFMRRGAGFVSSGKLRLSYGTGGNDNISDYGYLEQYDNSQFLYMGVRGLVSRGLFDDSRRWPLSRKAEVGFDIGILKDRVILQSSYYRNRTTNQIVILPLPGMAGPGIIEINSPATFQNSGMELVLSTVNVRSKNFSWLSSFNLTRARGKLVEFPNLEGSIYKDEYRIGKPGGMLAVYK
ncbi:MAG: SusC/RagA family TonB-linked outer membrane protein, partial [Chitinophagaceae bacterium]|nr:SusC/RagA family TonB-linked outer membrane protein [Chitinophagaceae bacterium]